MRCSLGAHSESMAKHTQSKDELVQHLDEQLGFLRSSAQAYDAGDTAEAKRLAVAVRILLHDTNSSHSLLGLLGVKDSLRFVDTAGELPALPPDRVLPNGSIQTTRMASCPLAPLRLRMQDGTRIASFSPRGDNLENAHQ